MIQKVVDPTSGPTETITSTYDEVRSSAYNIGKLTQQANGVARTCLDYNQQGTLQRQRWFLPPGTGPGCGSPTFDATTTYDLSGRVVWRTYPEGSSVGTTSNKWTYDRAGRLYTIPGFVTELTYLASRAWRHGASRCTDYK